MFKKLKDFNIENLTGGLIASFCALNLAGVVQLIYCGLAVVSFALTFKLTAAKNKAKVREMELQNKLLEADLKIKQIEIKNKEDEK